VNDDGLWIVFWMLLGAAAFAALMVGWLTLQR